MFGPGLPVVWGPSAGAAVKEVGRELFTHEWQENDPLARGDGLGPVFNARSCAACHFQGGVGGGGPNSANVMTFAVSPTVRDPRPRGGVQHFFAIDPRDHETDGVVREKFPIIPGGLRVVEGCSTVARDFDPVSKDVVNTTALFGAGWIDRISPRTIAHNQLRRMLANAAREFHLDFDTISAGRPHVLADGRIGKFGWKAQFATLEEFVAAACANELGLGNPLAKQPKPLGRPDYPDVPADLDRGQFRALTAFVATLPRPIEVVPDDPPARGAAHRGKELFTAVGCAVCHVPDPGGVAGVYSDFLLHDIGFVAPGGRSAYVQATPELETPAERARPEEWRTPPLWGAADSAPYFHDGGSPTLRDAIHRHGGGAAPVTRAFKALNAADQDAIVAFLGTLRAPAKP
jgi:CxxC motif-containing protein (DUF1111 family)